MASILIRNFDDELKARLRVRAAERGHSMEQEARAILRRELQGEQTPGLGTLAKRLFGEKNGIDLEPHPPALPRDPPDFGE
jgi:plasmid stability protein